MCFDPDFFPVYMNDLDQHFNLECDPLSINGKSISCLLYADGIVLMSQSANGLQKILNNVKLFCDKWNLTSLGIVCQYSVCLS